VKTGDKVQAGQKIGQCGNSGNSPVPHLHMHMQNTPDIFKGEGLPMQFRNYLANKTLVDSAELKSGEMIRNKGKK
jgi:murein DD-endopeptidase MepM/ murein hydrolase activator NlpD